MSVRAASQPRPDNFVDDWSCFHRSADEARAFRAATGWLFWADVSEYQPVITPDYPYPLFAERLDTGMRLDHNAVYNRMGAEKIKTIEALIGYVVFIPGQSTAQMKRLKTAFGLTDPGFAVMVDMESGSDFAGPGDHSVEANELLLELADWTGNPARSLGYANAYDWSSNWPSHPHNLKRVVADYGSQLVHGCWAQQYHGGGNTPAPPGFPTACRPFGSWVDMNARQATVPATLDDLGLDWLSMATEVQVKAAVVDALMSPAGQAALEEAAITALRKQAVNINGLLSFDHKAYPSIEAFLEGIPGYKTILARSHK